MAHGTDPGSGGLALAPDWVTNLLCDLGQAPAFFGFWLPEGLGLGHVEGAFCVRASESRVSSVALTCKADFPPVCLFTCWSLVSAS